MASSSTSSPLEQTSADLRAVYFSVQKLGDTFQNFQLQSFSILSLAEQWRTLQSSFATAYKSLEGKVKELESKEREIEAKESRLERGYEEVELERKKVEAGEISLSDKIKEVELRQNEVKKWIEVIEMQRREISERRKAVEAKERELSEGLRRVERVDEDEIRVERLKLEVDEKCKEVEFEMVRVSEVKEELKRKEERIDERCREVEMRDREVNERFKGLEERIQEVDLKEGEMRKRVQEMEAKEKELKEEGEEVKVKAKYMDEVYDLLEMREKEIDERVTMVEGKENVLKVREEEATIRLKGLKSKEIDVSDRLSVVENREEELRHEWKAFEEREKGINRYLEMREKEIDDRVKLEEGKENELKVREEEFSIRLEGLKSKEIDVSDRLSVVEIREEELRHEWRAFEEKEEGISRCLEMVDEREKEVEKERCRLELKDKQVNERWQVVQVKEGQLNENIDMIQAKEKQVNELSKVVEAKQRQMKVLIDQRSRALELKEKEIQEHREEVEMKAKRVQEDLQGLEIKEKHIDERSKAMDVKEKELNDRYIEMELKEKQMNRRRKALDLIEKNVEDRSKGLVLKEKETNVHCEMLKQKDKQIEELSFKLELKQKLANELLDALEEKHMSELYQALASKEEQSSKLVQAVELKENQFEGDFWKIFCYKEPELKDKPTNGSCKVLESEGKHCSREQNNVCSSRLELKGKQMADEALEVKLKQTDNEVQTLEKKQVKKWNEKLVVDRNDSSNKCTSMFDGIDGKALQIYLNERVDKYGSIRGEVIKVLKSSNYPAKLVLEALEGFFPPHLSKDGVQFTPQAVRSSCLLLLELLMNMKPYISRSLKKKATQVMMAWKSKLRLNGESVDIALGFLLLVVTYNLNLYSNKDVVSSLCNIIDQHKLAPRLRQRLGLLKRNIVSNNLPNSVKQPLESDHLQGASKMELSSSKDFPDIHSLCRSMDANGVRLYLVKHLQKHNINMLHEKILDALRYTADPARLVLNICQSSLTDLDKKSAYANKISCTFLLKVLTKLSPDIAPEVKNEARDFAENLKAIIKSNNPSEQFRYLQFIAAYKLASCYSVEDLLSHFNALYCGTTVFRPEENTYLCFALGISENIPGVIRSLIDKQKLVLAVKYICAFKLESDFPPVPLLETRLKLAKMAVEEKNEEGTFTSKVDAVNMESKALEEVVDCISYHKLESEFPLDALLSRLKELDKERESWGTSVIISKKRKANQNCSIKTQSQLEKRRVQIQPLTTQNQSQCTQLRAHPPGSQTYATPAFNGPNPHFCQPGGSYTIPPPLGSGNVVPAMYPPGAQYPLL